LAVYKRFDGKKITSSHPKYSQAKWWMRKRWDGKTIHCALPDARTKAQAEEAERKVLDGYFEKKQGREEVTFSKFAETYEKYVRQHNADVDTKLYIIRELKAFFRNKPLREITPQDCRDYQFKRKHAPIRTKNISRPRSPASVNREMAALSKLFSLAEEQDLIDKNPVKRVKRLRENPPRRRLLTDEQKKALFKELADDPWLYNVVVLAMNLPLRKAQILAIKKEDIDFQNGLLKVIASKGKPGRIVALTPDARTILQHLAERTVTGLVLKQNGRVIRDFKKRWMGVLRRAKINKIGGTREENFRFHDLRVEVGTELMKHNPLTVVQKMFDHSSPNITDIYLKVELDVMRNAASKMRSVLPEREPRVIPTENEE
jgi:integrase